MRWLWWLPVVLVVFAVPVVSATDPTPDPRLPERVAEIVKRLTNDDFDLREGAQKQLTDLGPVVLSILEQFEPFHNPEVALRVRRVQRALGGATEEIRQALETDLPFNEFDHRRGLNSSLRERIVENQPKSGDFLLSVIENPKHRLHRPAVNAFVQTWDTMTAEQVHTYLQRSLIMPADSRPKFPRGVDASIAMGYCFRYDWSGLPVSQKQMFFTETTHFLDGKQYGDPYRYPHTSAQCTTGWVKTKDLSVGRHTVFLVVKYAADHREKIVTGTIRLEGFAFEVLPADAPDDLIAPKDAEVDKLVRSALRLAETEDGFAPIVGFGRQEDRD